MDAIDGLETYGESQQPNVETPMAREGKKVNGESIEQSEDA
ncbi:hypothetical protein WN944_013888 [Citrus x changshan-huyou]|uniref:Uncharacterized protein n=1 Tax=Citrus x changshan-huyou TaxID=2935761 RepID=A0AAP0M6X8_9ROSI